MPKMSSGSQYVFQSKAIGIMLNIAAISAVVVCTLLQLYPSSNNSNFAIAASSSETILSIMAVGDSIGFDIDSKKLSNLSQIIKSPDIFIFNLEGVLMESLEKAKECKGFPSYQSIFVSNSSFVRHLKLAPISVANLANNHIYDCGTEGIKETKKILDEEGFLSVGAGQNLQEACEPLSIEFKGKTINFVSYNFMIRDLVSAHINRSGAADRDLCSHDYNQLKDADFVIASIHLGYWSANVTQRQVTEVQRLFDAGVDIVIGHSPHIPQAIATTEAGNLAFFSLGNFILNPDHLMPPLAHTSIVPRLDIYTHNNTMNLTIYPINIDNEGIPHMEENNNNTIISRIVKDSDNFYTSIGIRDNLGQLSVVPNQ
jgi:poly-gamma-glutamate capsule biosynthesis protein CapA/YwtB (metallophosphatase superfamily)